jgi:hypothetical protein
MTTTPDTSVVPEIEIDYDDYGLHEQDSATTIIRIDHDTSLFEQIGKIESVSSGVVTDTISS